MKKNKVFLIVLVAASVGWSVFQLIYNSSYVYLDFMVLRNVHLMFAVVLTFLYAIVKAKKARAWKTALMLFLAGISLLSFIYIPLNMARLTTRMAFVDQLTNLDLLIGIAIIIVVLETTRRTIGLPLVILTLIFIAYGLFGQYIPGGLSHTPILFRDYIDNLVFTAEGVFGLPIAVTSTYVYLFLIFASFLIATRAGEFFTDTALAITGRTRGGPAKAAVIASSLVGMISGSAVANVATSGPITIPMMKKTGYNTNFAGAVEAVSSTGGQLVPPVMGAAAFVMAQLTGISYWNICLAAILPAVLYYAALFAGVHFEAVRTNIGAMAKDSVPSLKKTILGKGHVAIALFVLIFLLAQNYSAAMAVFWATVTLFFISFIRASTRFTLKSFIGALESAAKTALTVVPSCACVGLIIGTIMQTGIGLKMSSVLTSWTGGNILLLLIVLMVAAYLLGMGMPTTPAYITVAALIVPLLIMQNIPAIAAHMFALYYSLLSMITPPVALAAYAAAGIAQGDPMKTGWISARLGLLLMLIPFMFVYRTGLLLIGTPADIAVNFIIAFIGTIALAVSLSGCFLRPIKVPERLLWLAGAFLTIAPGWVTTIVGLVIIAVLFFFQLYRSAYFGRKPQVA